MRLSRSTVLNGPRHMNHLGTCEAQQIAQVETEIRPATKPQAPKCVFCSIFLDANTVDVNSGLLGALAATNACHSCWRHVQRNMKS